MYTFPSHSSMRNYLSCSFWSPYRASPFLMDQYTNDSWVGGLLTFFTVLSYVCPVSMKLHANWKSPFRNVPNELPLVTMQAFYNEALLTMYSGYHPDHTSGTENVSSRHNGESSKQKWPPPSNDNNRYGNQCQRTASALEPSTAPPKPAKDDEIAALKQQLAEQAKWIEQLASKLNNNLKGQLTENGVLLETVEDE